MASPQQPAPPTNPFDGFDNYANVAQQPPQQHQPPNQWGQPQQQPMAPQQAAAANPFGFAQAPAPVANSAHNPNPFGAAAPSSPQRGSMVQQPVPQQQPPQPPQQQQQFAAAPMSQAMVPAFSQQPQPPQQQPPPPQQQQPHQQQLVPLAPNAIVQSPWALNQLVPAQPQQQVAPAPAAGGQPYDPFGIFNSPTPAPAAPPAQPPMQAQQQQPPFQAQPPHPYAQQPPQPAQLSAVQQNLHKEAQSFNINAPNHSILPDESEDEGLALVDVELDDGSDGDDTENLERRRNDGEFIGRGSNDSNKHGPSRSSRGATPSSNSRNSWDRNPDIAPPPPMTPGRRHAEYLAGNSAPALSSPLPKPQLVHHSGYVLSRISFRTVLMRKWKQTFWIQYGPTQLLFFRTFSDYEDWLNNPYHTQKAREFLVKLRVDFVSDLKKSSVMGYQVTQVRRKPYGKNVMLHFKLERWMDYGPTIAAAFAAREEEMMNSPSHYRNGDSSEMNTSNDVASLRKIILGCMRNARDAALIASRQQSSSMGEAVGYRGRYDAEHERGVRIPTSSSNMGYHQAFSAESSERRRMSADGELESEEESQVEPEPERPAAPVVDLLG